MQLALLEFNPTKIIQFQFHFLWQAFWISKILCSHLGHTRRAGNQLEKDQTMTTAGGSCFPIQSFVASISFHLSFVLFVCLFFVGFYRLPYSIYGTLVLCIVWALYLRQSDNGRDPARIRHLLLKDACYCHRSEKRPCFSKFSGKKEDDLNSFVKVFWTLEKPAQDEFATSSVVIETDFLQMISKGIGLVIYFGFKFIFVHGFVFPRSNSPSLRSTRQWSHRKRGIVHGSCLGRLSATNALPPYSGSDHSVYELQVLEN